MSQFEPRVVTTAAALIIGAELLSGKIRDENLYALSQTLRALGISLCRVIICPDEQTTISRDVAELSRNYDLVITSGGVGPTHDDVTMSGVADALGVPLVQSRELAAIIRRAYGDATAEAHLLMARVPEGSYLAESEDVRWPTVVAHNIWILPGVPELFRMKLAALRKHVRGPQVFYSESVYCDLEETSLKELLDEVVTTHGQVEIGSYPKWFDPRYKTRVTVDSRSADATRAATQHLKELLGSHVVVGLDFG